MQFYLPISVAIENDFEESSFEIKAVLGLTSSLFSVKLLMKIAQSKKKNIMMQFLIVMVLVSIIWSIC